MNNFNQISNLLSLLLIVTFLNCKDKTTSSESDFKLIDRNSYYIDSYNGIGYYRDNTTHKLLNGYFVVVNETYKWEEFNVTEGVLNGDNILFHDNGNMFSKISYKNGKRHGEERIYSRSGVLTTLNTYKNDIKYGKSYSYFNNGKIKTESKIKKGKVIESVTYNIIGEMESQMFLEDGKQITQRLKNGVLFFEEISSTYDNFEATKLYNEDGSLKLFLQMLTQGEDAFIIERDENGNEIKRVNIKEHPEEIMKYKMLLGNF